MLDHVLDHPGDQRPAPPVPPLRTGFHCGTESPGGGLVLRLQGELDMASAPKLRRLLDTALDGRPAELVLDLRELTFIDSSGIRVLSSSARRAEAAGCTLALRSPARSVLKVLRLTGLDRLTMVMPATPST